MILSERCQHKWGLGGNCFKKSYDYKARGVNKSRDWEGHVSRKVMIISERCQQKQGLGANCFKKSDDYKREVSTKVGMGSEIFQENGLV